MSLGVGLDIGCGPNPNDRGRDLDMYGIDIVPSEDGRVVQANMGFGDIPFDDYTFDRVFAYDFLEHIPMRAWLPEFSYDPFANGYAPNGKVKTIDCMINVFDEVYRVLKIGGVFETFTPHMPHYHEMYRDPTHVSVWTEQSWEYWAGSLTGLMRHYGYKAEFNIIYREWRGPHYYVELIKVQ